MSSTLIERIKEALEAHVPDAQGMTQWYIDDLAVDCDGEEFWTVLERIVTLEKDKAIRDASDWMARALGEPIGEPSRFGPCQLYPARDCPGCELTCARVSRLITSEEDGANADDPDRT